MSLSIRILVGYFVIVGLTGLFALMIVVREVKPSIRETIEESMVDTANLLAALASDELRDGTLANGRFASQVRAYSERQVDAPIYHFRKTSLDYRIYVTDARGIVMFDSEGRAEGQDYSRWNDVARTLKGGYGARSTRTEPSDDASSVFHVAAPVIDAGKIIGVLTVAKPIAKVDPIIARSENVITRYGIALVVASLLLGLFVTIRLSLSVRRLQRFARDVAEGQRAEVPHSGARELNDLARAMATMREKLDGKQYVERYVQALTHELKSPLAAIRGASELLAEADLPAPERMRFAQNVQSQSLRMQSAIDRLLLLSRLEARDRPPVPARFDVTALIERCLAERQPLAEQREVSLKAGSIPDVAMLGDEGLIAFALGNLIDNAIDFSPPGAEVEVSVSLHDAQARLSVRDHGAGIPDFAQEKIFERFYSLPRPGGSQRGSGLGLAMVREIADLHGGTVELANQPGGGVFAVLTLPRA
ncbi:two-component system sensor histidine kinase CreC [Niveibacterium sp. 24ML]|uniref:two-component system sensor histidine kinase CreC n=1 Tax=Niveibacterium sp. 24ML TaxID=2985512 RepID=UPI0022706A2E|nr:two-component system sensor histidine kinase CreC [Niveibacterium sp. 24ML]MCX9156091.1 two-component system sensor histidine kinase CreC [Niveibacterium sp. 24ML]